MTNHILTSLKFEISTPGHEIFCIFLLLLYASRAYAADVSIKHVVEVSGSKSGVEGDAIKTIFSAFFNALKKGDAEQAFKFIYSPPGAEQRTKARVIGLARMSTDKGAAPEYIDSYAISTVALGIIKDVAKTADGSPDFDAVLLLKRNGKWGIVLSIAELENGHDVLTADERACLANLRSWQEIRMIELSKPVSKPK